MEAKNEEIVSSEYLSDLFGSDRFILTNLKAGKRTARTGHETAYEIFKPLGKDKYTISRIFEGNSYSTEGVEERLEKHHNNLVESFAIYRLISAHFHPNFQLIPSPNDLFISHATKTFSGQAYGFNLNPISIIGRATDGIDLLLYQQKPEEIPEGLYDQLLDDLYDYSFCNEYNEKSPDYPYEVAEKMRESALYRTAVIRIDNSGKIDFNPKEIEDFSFKAKKLPDYFEGFQLGS